MITRIAQFLAAALCSFLLAFAVVSTLTCCGVLNLGSKGEDGQPKTGDQAVAVAAAFADAAIQVWGMPAARVHAPELIPLLDANGDGAITVAEIAGRMEGSDRATVRTAIDTALRTWGSDELRRRAPDVVRLFDRSGDGQVSLEDIEAKVDLTQPGAAASLIAAGIILWQNKP